MSENTYYIKKEKKFIPVGFEGPELYNGIWLVEAKDGCKSHTNIRQQLAELPKDPRKLEIFSKLVLLEKTVMDVMQDCWDHGKSCTLYECARKISVELAKKEIKINKNKQTKIPKTLKLRGEVR